MRRLCRVMWARHPALFFLGIEPHDADATLAGPPLPGRGQARVTRPLRSTTQLAVEGEPSTHEHGHVPKRKGHATAAERHA